MRFHEAKAKYLEGELESKSKVGSWLEGIKRMSLNFVGKLKGTC